ncbi:hypothetical protein F5890DRAFT_1479113 [Lentinula detonsa]|uniref:Zn(2)-C6 fungal-type domain-containing protein n=1 Tax=Lentinula detonsa TaxID=2804962 RepID=A0AA38PNA7_9AGAR|nr:hypothetical protein F5890DRAFT_1479113 [Lentinula detonsa]
MSPTPSRPSSPSNDEERAEELRLQKKREEREKQEAERRAEEEEEATAKARLAEIRRKKEEKKKREAEEKKKEEEEKKKREEEEEQERKKKEKERVVKEKKEKEEREKEKREEENRAKSVGALVQASIVRRGKRDLPIDVDSVERIGKKRKRVARIPSNGSPGDDEPNPGEDNEASDSNSDEYKNDIEDHEEEDPYIPPTPTPTSTPRKPLKCDCCTSKDISCSMIGSGSASCIACRKAKVKCLLVGNERTVRRSKRLKREESAVASSSSERIEVLEERNQELAHRLFLLEDMVRFIIQTIRPVDANEESEEDRVKRTGDVKGKGRKE